MHDVLADRYELGAELGRGGMARVVEARDIRLDRAVAVKLIPIGPGTTDSLVRQRFVREARSAASFAHPHAVSIYDAGVADGFCYLVMELVDGPSLATLLATEGPLALDRALGIVDQVLQALAAAHRAGIVHRDVKPGNVLVTAGGVAKLADFGIAKRFDDLAGELTTTGQVVGTPAYLAPEQVVGGAATPATDVYATGVLLFELLAGAPPFDGGSPIATALAHRDEAVPDVRERRPDVPAGVAGVVRRAMAKDPADRFGSADAMRVALGEPEHDGGTTRQLLAPDAAAEGRSLLPTVVLTAPSRRASRAWWWVALGVAATVAITVALLGRVDDPPGEDAPTVVTSASATVAPSTAVAATAASPSPATTSVPSDPTSAPPVAPTTVQPAPDGSTVVDVLVLLDADPARFGQHAEEVRRDLERITDRDGRQRERDIERLRGRLADWTADGTMPAEVAVLVDAALADALEGGGEAG